VPKTLEFPREGFQILTRFDFCNLLGMRPVLQIHSAITPDFELLPCVFVLNRLSCTNYGRSSNLSLGGLIHDMKIVFSFGIVEALICLSSYFLRSSMLQR